MPAAPLPPALRSGREFGPLPAMTATIPVSARRLAPLALAVAALLLWAAAALGQGLKFPELSGRVVDAAGVIDAASRERIAAKLAAHEAKTSDQIVVATVPSLQGTSIEDFANQLFRHWKLGQAKTSNGVLLLVAPAERKLRIEVGYGLEGSLTDATSRLIIQAAIAPKFRAGDFGGGVEAGVEAIVSTVTGDGEWQERVKLRNPDSDDGMTEVMAIIVFIFIIFVVVNMMAARNRPPGGWGRMHRRRSGDWIVINPGGNSSGGWSGGGGWGGGSSGGGGFSGGGGSSGGGGASGDW